MAETHADAVAYVASVLGALSPLVGAAVNPPESINQFPFAVVWVGPGTSDVESDGWLITLDELVIQIHAARSILPSAVALLTPLFDSVPVALFKNPTTGATDPTLGGTVVTIRGPITHSGIATLEWASEKHLGVEFRVPVKFHPTIS